MSAMWQDARSGYVYVMASEHMPGLLKIGKANHPEQRRLQLATGCPGLVIWAVTLCQDMAQTEAHLHRTFSDRRVSQSDGRDSEWFRIEDVETIFNATQGAAWETTEHCGVDVQLNNDLRRRFEENLAVLYPKLAEHTAERDRVHQEMEIWHGEGLPYPNSQRWFAWFEWFANEAGAARAEAAHLTFGRSMIGSWAGHALRPGLEDEIRAADAPAAYAEHAERGYVIEDVAAVMPPVEATKPVRLTPDPSSVVEARARGAQILRDLGLRGLS